MAFWHETSITLSAVPGVRSLLLPSKPRPSGTAPIFAQAPSLWRVTPGLGSANSGGHTGPGRKSLGRLPHQASDHHLHQVLDALGILVHGDAATFTASGRQVEYYGYSISS